MKVSAIKICGITTPDAMDSVIRCRVDYAGFVFYPPSPRNLSYDAAHALALQAAGRIYLVGLFVDADDATIAQAIAATRLQTLQLHGMESPERVAQIRTRFGLPVWKALPVAGTQDIARAAAYQPCADLILFDAKTPKGALPGGMGLSFDWSLLSGWKDVPGWGLAGGLNACNVADALQATAAPLVDASSGVESTPGIKDPAKIAAFCKAVRSWPAPNI